MPKPFSMPRGEKRAMPTLLETQEAMHRCLLADDDSAALPLIVDDGIAPASLIAVHRNTLIGTLTKALQLSFPAVCRLVSEAFFESAAQIFIAQSPPQSAYLNEYGADFPAFLAQFEPVAALAYLPGVARLEWAVHSAFHAADALALDTAALAAIPAEDHERIVFEPHPAIGLVRADHPVDDVWRAVLEEDDDAMAAIDLDKGPVWLMVERRGASVEVTCLNEDEWRFIAALRASVPLQAAIQSVPDLDVPLVLAQHVAAGRFTGFALGDANATINYGELST